MLTIRKLFTDHLERAPRLSLTLSFDERKRSRSRSRLDDGTEVALLLERGKVLRGGDVLVADDGTLIIVRAKPEVVTTVHARDPWALARAAYHLGNRHVPLQIGEGFVRYEHDHVLDDMVRALGLEADIGRECFEPEGGSYARADAHGQVHTHDHDHDHDHDLDHDHDHGQLGARSRR